MRELVTVFAYHNRHLEIPIRAVGRCVEVSERFAMFAAQRGHRGPVDVVRCQDVRLREVKDGPFYLDHVANFYQGYVIDFTARQFWFSVPFPYVIHIENYQEHWHERIQINPSGWRVPCAV